MSDNREKARSLLTHYFREAIVQDGGGVWGCDNADEIEQLTNLIFDEIEERCKPQSPCQDTESCFFCGSNNIEWHFTTWNEGAPRLPVCTACYESTGWEYAK